MRALALLGALLVGACECRCVGLPPQSVATAPPVQPLPGYYRNKLFPDSGPTEWDRDKYRCRRENTHEPLDPKTGIAYVDENTVGLCLRAKGWYPAPS